MRSFGPNPFGSLFVLARHAEQRLVHALVSGGSSKAPTSFGLLREVVRLVFWHRLLTPPQRGVPASRHYGGPQPMVGGTLTGLD